MPPLISLIVIKKSPFLQTYNFFKLTSLRRKGKEHLLLSAIVLNMFIKQTEISSEENSRHAANIKKRARKGN